MSDGSVVDCRWLRRPAGTVLTTLLVAAAYYLSGRLGLLGRLDIEGVVVTPVWPPTGVAVAALLVFGLRVWPGVALGSLLVIASLTTPQATTLVNVAGNTAAPLCAVLLLRRIGFRPDVSRLRDGMALVFGGLCAMVISSTAGVGVQVLTGKLDTGDFWTVWLAWWVGDTMGVLLVTPLILLFLAPKGRFGLHRWKEALCLVVTALVLVPLAALSPISLLFLVFPLLVWAALRFELIGSMSCALFASVLATFEANTGGGAFVRQSGLEVMAKLGAFNGAVALTALLLSSLVTEQRATRRSIQRACDELAEVLDHLTAGENLPNAAGQRATDDGPRPPGRAPAPPPQ
ncbi:MASE1 domain-containing protein [Streptomyces sp. NPDC088785]|uniref:MASE1 domain-containing protein n=1 Tax=Streptomyces sp. NPDC088785 TaxID=3365897 RepID=UPI0038008B48